MATVASLSEIKILSDGRRLQSATVVDKSGSATLTLLEQWVNLYLRNKEFDGQRQLYTPTHSGVSITEVEPLADVAPTIATNSDNNVKVIAIANLSSITVCISCKAQVMPDEEIPQIGHCLRCKNTMLLSS